MDEETAFTVNILGINAYHANASAALVCDGRLIAAVEEERFNRVKYAAGFPVSAIRYCLNAAGITLADVDHIAVPRNPWARIGTKLLYALRMPRFARDRKRAWGAFARISETLAEKFDLDPQRIGARIHRVEHHRAHLAGGFFVSPFDQAAVLSADGLGDFASAMWAEGAGNRMRIRGSIAFPHSLGLYYTALAQYLGFWKFGDEYKVMGLAAYGEPSYLEEFRRIVISDGPDFRLGLEYFSHHRQGPDMSWNEPDKTPVLGRLFSTFLERRLGPARAPEAPIEQKHKDIASSLQVRLEEVFISKTRSLHRQTGCKALCLSGGVAFNCVANTKILDQVPIDRIFVQPAAGDAGLALGAAFYVWHEILRQPRSFEMKHAFWGPEYSREEIRKAIGDRRLFEAGFNVCELRDEETGRAVAHHIAAGGIVGWFFGRAEWGPRALGHRSILADPRRAEMKELLNQRIKHREMFRPFAPSILAEYTGQFFETDHPSPFMTFAYRLRPEKREAIPAATHVDGTCRLQTVDRKTNPRFWEVIDEFRQLTNIPAVVNTSFNDNEPIVCAPAEAINCFLRTHMDVLVLGNSMVCKARSTDGAGVKQVINRETSEVPR
jgi:carbamoyltransferase